MKSEFSRNHKRTEFGMEPTEKKIYEAMKSLCNLILHSFLMSTRDFLRRKIICPREEHLYLRTSSRLYTETLQHFSLPPTV